MKVSRFNRRRYMDLSSITTVQLDVLKEISNIGAGNAATSLSQILGQKVDMHVPNASVVDFNDLLGIFGDAFGSEFHGLVILLEYVCCRSVVEEDVVFHCCHVFHLVEVFDSGLQTIVL